MAQAATENEEKEQDGQEQEEPKDEQVDEAEANEEQEGEVEANEAEDNDNHVTVEAESTGSRLVSAKTQRPHVVKRVDDDTAELQLRGRDVPLRIPPEYRDEWTTDAEADAPGEVEFALQWVYGYRGRGAGSDGLHLLPATGELAYFVAGVVVLYNGEAQTQRHYRGHSNDVLCLTVHHYLPLCASGQAEGHQEESDQLQSAHVQVWNYDSLQLVSVVGDDYFTSAVTTVAFSKGDSVLLATVDSEDKPQLSIWEGIGDDMNSSEPTVLMQSVAASAEVHALKFVPDADTAMVSVGKGHVSLWELKDGELEKSQGLFTRKIQRPSHVLCTTFAANNEEILTGDSDGNVMIWKSVKVVRVLKGAHQGAVGDICVMPEDGVFVSGGMEDGAFVVFDVNYQLIGAGAALPSQLGCVRRIRRKNYSANEDGRRFFHLVVGTTANCVVEVSFRISPEVNAIEDVEVETLVHGHGGEVNSVAAVAGQDKFFSGGDDRSVVLWDAVAHKAVWSAELADSVKSVASSADGSQFAVGLESGKIFSADLETKFLTEAYDAGTEITALGFSPDGAFLGAAAKDHQVHVLQRKKEESEEAAFEINCTLTGHTSHVSHLDWSHDSAYLRTNSTDYEVLFWSVESKTQVTDAEEIDSIGGWATQQCTLSFETLGIWPQLADGTDINACDAAGDLIAVGDDFGRIRVLRYPATSPWSGALQLLGHSAHVTDVAFISEGSGLVSAGGREASIMQWEVIKVIDNGDGGDGD